MILFNLKSLLVLTSLFWSAEHTQAKQPHILLVIADDLGWHDVGFHGSEIRTPVLDDLAKDAVLLDNYYVQPVCSPTRTSLLTGRYPIRYGLLHHVYSNGDRFSLYLNETLLPEKLVEAGYATHMVGKWHLGFSSWKHVPTARGFQSFFGFYGGAEDYLKHSAGGGVDYRNGTAPVGNLQGTYSAFTFASEAQRVVREHISSASGKPLFLYLAFQNVHSPQEVPDSYVEPYNTTIQNNQRRRFAGMVSIMDEAIGNVTGVFKELGLWNDTLMVFSTDNGGPVNKTFSGIGACNWPLRGSKHTLWEGGVRGTAFIRGAGVQAASQNSTALMHATDWFPTLLHAAGGNTNGTLPLDGKDLWEVISTGQGNSPRTEILHNYDPMASGGDKGCCGYAGLRQGDWKLLINPGGPDGWYPPPDWHGENSEHFTPNHFKSTLREHRQLFGFTGIDREAEKQNTTKVYLFRPRDDPQERNDVSSDNPDVVKQMTARLHQLMSEAMPDGHMGNDPASNPKNFGGFWTPWLNSSTAN